MRTLIILAVGLLAVGCGKSEPLGSGKEYNAGLATVQNTTKEKPAKELTLEEEKVVGTYEISTVVILSNMSFLKTECLRVMKMVRKKEKELGSSSEKLKSEMKSMLVLEILLLF